MWLQAAEMVDKALQREYGDMRGYGGAQALVELAGQFRARAAAPAPAGDGAALVTRLDAAAAHACEYAEHRAVLRLAARALTAAPGDGELPHNCPDCTDGTRESNWNDDEQPRAQCGTCDGSGRVEPDAAPGDGPADLVSLLERYKTTRITYRDRPAKESWDAFMDAHDDLLAWTPATPSPLAPVEAPETVTRRQAEDLWEELGGACVCQATWVGHWCETCQRKISLIENAFRAALTPDGGAR